MSLRLAAGLLALLACLPAAAQYPEIRSLQPSDPLFRQHQSDLAAFYLWAARPASDQPVLSLYEYQVQPDQDLLGLSARLGLRPDTLASLNGAPTTAAVQPGDRLLVPSIQALFLAEGPRTALEELMWAGRSEEAAEAPRVRILIENVLVDFRVLMDARLSPLERAYLVRRLFRLPLSAATLTSGFGPRPSPFSGKPQFHGGVDLAAQSGEPVLAAAPGVVSRVSEDQVYGVHVVIDHEDGYQSLYGHLASTSVGLGTHVAAGALLGLVGSTGLTTGPHLHFELHRDGRRLDPASLTDSQGLRRDADGDAGGY